MSEVFKLGEIVIGQNFVDFPEHNGEELLITKGLAYRVSLDQMTLNPDEGFNYEVRDTSGYEFLAAPHNLRRRKPPMTGERSILALFWDAPRETSTADYIKDWTEDFA